MSGALLRGARGSRARRKDTAPVLAGRLRALTPLPLLLALSLQGCSGDTPLARLRRFPPRNLLLVTIDTLRADRVGCYGYAGARTPNLDRLAAEGVRFENAIASVPITLPSHASLLTGLYPASHGVQMNGRQRLPEEIPTLPELLGTRIPRRGAVVASASLDSVFGLDRGFMDYDDQMPPVPQDNWLFLGERRAAEVARLAKQWLADTEEPFFLWVHWFDPHAPYDAPPPWNERLADPYDAEVATADEALGSVLEELRSTGALERTLVVVAGDHGESLGEHGEPTHGLFLYDTTVRVPLLFRYPAGLPAGRVVSGQTRLIDVMPTVLDLWGIDAPAGIHGTSLVPMLAGERQDLGLEAYLETQLPAFEYSWSPLRGLRGSDWKYVAAPEEELYDLSSDPGELENLAPRDRRRAASLRSRLEEIAARVSSSRSSQVHLTRELRRQLESLGYIGGRDRLPEEPSGPDPKHMTHIMASLQRAAKAFEAGRYEAVIPGLRAVLEEDPQNVFARRILARSLLRSGRGREGEQEYRRLLENAPSDAEAMTALGTLAMHAGRFEEAEHLLRAGQEVIPWDPAIRNNLAFLLARRGDLEGAQRLMREILLEDPKFVEAALNLAALHRKTGDYTEAEAALRDLLRHVPGQPSVLRALAGLLAEQGRGEEARRLLEPSSR